MRHCLSCLQAMPLLPEAEISRLSERVLQLQALDNKMLVQSALHCIKVCVQYVSATHMLEAGPRSDQRALPS
jgi:hypothetical protein